MTDLESLLAEALCGSPTRSTTAPCRYHVAQAKLALNALAGAGMVVLPRLGPIRAGDKYILINDRGESVEMVVQPGAQRRSRAMEPIDLDAIEAAVGIAGAAQLPFIVRELIMAVRERDAEIARLTAPPGADVLERARQARRNAQEAYGCCGIEGVLDEAIANAIQQYGDERAREARVTAAIRQSTAPSPQSPGASKAHA